VTLKPFLEFLRDRFRSKIDPDEYYLSYSGGKDSHFLMWFIREYMDEHRIPIVAVNTGFELPEIRDRILKNSDIVLHPELHRQQIKDNYGIPCFSKQQDEYIWRYQNGSRSENTMRAVNGENTLFNLNQTARELLLSGKLHRVSNKCCKYNKERPMMQYGKETGRKAIMGTRQNESRTRKAKYNKCLTAKGNFTPLYDFSDELMDGLYKEYNIEIPKCYTYLSRTGCGGCPYGRNTETELAMLPRLQRAQTIKFFKESYDVLGIDYNNIQSLIGYEEL
jgi:3'-phosphoadenosine 5'-phosphosulfate sulfotransferase (PAPS reductase)/FAD synthetase